MVTAGLQRPLGAGTGATSSAHGTLEWSESDLPRIRDDVLDVGGAMTFPGFTSLPFPRNAVSNPKKKRRKSKDTDEKRSGIIRPSKWQFRVTRRARRAAGVPNGEIRVRPHVSSSHVEHHVRFSGRQYDVFCRPEHSRLTKKNAGITPDVLIPSLAICTCHPSTAWTATNGRESRTKPATASRATRHRPTGFVAGCGGGVKQDDSAAQTAQVACGTARLTGWAATLGLRC